MSWLVRKIEKGKWMQNDIINGSDISADAITNCMKTTRNTLSTWEINDESEIEKAILAIVSCHQHLDTIDIVCFDLEILKNKGIKIEKTQGATQINALKDNHVDISDLTYSSLGTVACLIVECIKQGGVKRYTKLMLKKILNTALDSSQVSLDEISPSLLK